ncbi:unnamed protein product [Ceratitis capitata]|uniref:(Mediterranean fruit fly) hypothetical protein n=1 Tax=Ceratitis capitata TaxID=7213 RepID=A0A811U630_CERCA|nr:unnamed protein product [Ceratitis capitata]
MKAPSDIFASRTPHIRHITPSECCAMLLEFALSSGYYMDLRADLDKELRNEDFRRHSVEEDWLHKPFLP